jgi:hypothetical protein
LCSANHIIIMHRPVTRFGFVKQCLLIGISSQESRKREAADEG